MMVAKTDWRVAILADIHANSIALEAVLDDIKAQGGVDEYWFLGDYVALGPDPVGVLEQLGALENARFIRGNTERYVTNQQLQSPSAEDLEGYTPGEIAKHIRMASSFSWTLGAIATKGWLPWLAALPLEERMELPDGTRVLAVHASPGQDDGDGVNPATDKDTLRILLAEARADLVLVGHTHCVCDHRVDRIRVVNPGSISNPLPPDLRASYALLRADRSGCQIEFRQVDYNRQAVIEAMQQLRHPSRAYITQLMKGQIKPEWEK